jgi:hypothetical protein
MADVTRAVGRSGRRRIRRVRRARVASRGIQAQVVSAAWMYGRRASW